MILPDIQILFNAGILAGLIFTAAAILLVPDWRIALFALAIQYVLVAMLLATFVQFPVAVLRVVSGSLALLILYLTLRGIEEAELAASMDPNDRTLDQTAARLYKPHVFHVGFPFRVLAVALVLVSITSVVTTISFLDLPNSLLFSSLWLMTAGILVSVLSRNAPRLGTGILMFTGGFSILEMAIEGSLFLYGLITISDLLLALLIAHLATLPQQIGTGRRRGEPQ